MDGHSAILEVQRSECKYNSNRAVVVVDNWAVEEMVFTQEKVQWLWQEMSKYRTLFNDYTRGDVENFGRLLLTPDSYWLEVVDIQNCISVGVIYLMHIARIIDPEVHIIFFDRKLADKVDLCKEVARFLFNKFPMHRMTAITPKIYHSTIRLAEKVGFKREGVMRESQYMGGKYVDEIVLGLLSSEV